MQLTRDSMPARLVGKERQFHQYSLQYSVHSATISFEFIVIVSLISKMFIDTLLMIFKFIISVIVFHKAFTFFIFIELSFVISILCDS